MESVKIRFKKFLNENKQIKSIINSLINIDEKIFLNITKPIYEYHKEVKV